jgi:hypothetical protein
VTACRTGLAGIAVSLACFLTVALLGPSAEEPALPGPGLGSEGLNAPGKQGPPFAFAAHPSPYLVIGLVAVGAVLGAAGLGLCLYGLGRGGRLPARALLIAGLLATAAFALTPPVGSSDHLNYMAYGRMYVLGHSPYTTTARDLPHDPVIRAVQEWPDTPSVYGPLVTAQQAFASWVGGDSVRLTVFVLSVTNALAFALAGLLLYRAGGGARGMLLWTLNPLMLFHLVSGAHNDALGIAAAVAALTVFHRLTLGRTLAAGALTGVAVAVKLPAGLVGGGPAWTLAHRLWKTRERRFLGLLTALFGAAGLVVLAAYSWVGTDAVGPVRDAAKMISLASPWHLLHGPLLVLPRPVLQAGALLLMIALIGLLARSLPATADQSARTAGILVLAWLFSTLYILPWYDGLGWAVLALPALAGWTRVQWVLLAHTLALTLAYLPARAAEVIGLPPGLRWLQGTLRTQIMPWVLLAVLAALVLPCLRRRPPRPAPAHGATPPAAAAPRP